MTDTKLIDDLAGISGDGLFLLRVFLDAVDEGESPPPNALAHVTAALRKLDSTDKDRLKRFEAAMFNTGKRGRGQPKKSERPGSTGQDVAHVRLYWLLKLDPINSHLPDAEILGRVELEYGLSDATIRRHIRDFPEEREGAQRILDAGVVLRARSAK